MTDEQKKEKEEEKEKEQETTETTLEDFFGIEGDEALPEKTEKKEQKKTGKRKIRSRKKVARTVVRGAVHIQASYNNTIVSFADEQGNVLSWSSAGKVGFKGPKKSTPYAAVTVVRDASQSARDTYGMRDVDVFVRGIGPGRDAAVRALSSHGFTVHIITDLTPLPHNGCRPAKVRRV